MSARADRWIATTFSVEDYIRAAEVEEVQRRLARDPAPAAGGGEAVLARSRRAILRSLGAEGIAILSHLMRMKEGSSDLLPKIHAKVLATASRDTPSSLLWVCARPGIRRLSGGGEPMQVECEEEEEDQDGRDSDEGDEEEDRDRTESQERQAWKDWRQSQDEWERHMDSWDQQRYFIQMQQRQIAAQRLRQLAQQRQMLQLQMMQKRLLGVQGDGSSGVPASVEALSIAVGSPLPAEVAHLLAQQRLHCLVQCSGMMSLTGPSGCRFHRGRCRNKATVAISHQGKFLNVVQTGDAPIIQRLGEHMVPGYIEIAQKQMGGFLCVCDACKQYFSL